MVIKTLFLFLFYLLIPAAMDIWLYKQPIHWITNIIIALVVTVAMHILMRK